jgi:hypothetical protein
MNESTNKTVVLREGDNIINDHYEVHDHDVLFGRGNRTYYHPGNGFYRDLISKQCEKYNTPCSQREMCNICKNIYDSINAQDPPGKLLRECKNQIDHWESVSEDDAIKKISQAFRDKMNIRGRKNNDNDHILSSEVSGDKWTYYCYWSLHCLT